jgi:DNA-damage-inducible protein D
MIPSELLPCRVGAKVRETIKDIGGTMPEDLPTPEASIKELEKRRRLSLPSDDDENQV